MCKVPGLLPGHHLDSYVTLVMHARKPGQGLFFSQIQGRAVNAALFFSTIQYSKQSANLLLLYRILEHLFVKVLLLPKQKRDFDKWEEH